MVSLRLQFLVQDNDRHGNVRYYVRVKGKPKVRVRGIPGSEDFMAAYHGALAGIESGDKRKQHHRPPKNSFGDICLAYYDSPTFKALDPSTQSWRRHHLDRICEKNGHKPISDLKPKHVRILRDELIQTPGASRTRLKALKALFRWATERGRVDHDPTRDVHVNPYQEKGHHPWSSDEIAAFEQRHPIGTKPRLAMALMFYTSCRKEDAVRLGPQHIKDGRLRYTQAKNEHRKAIHIDIPVFGVLADVIAASTLGEKTFLVTEYGQPFTVGGFGNAMRDWCDQANLHHCSSHGLRKAFETRLAECGATPHEMMAITGHQNLAQVELYTRAANKALLADSGMSKLK
jgi:integrase/recombinase XerD